MAKVWYRIGLHRGSICQVTGASTFGFSDALAGALQGWRKDVGSGLPSYWTFQVEVEGEDKPRISSQLLDTFSINGLRNIVSDLDKLRQVSYYVEGV